MGSFRQLPLEVCVHVCMLSLSRVQLFATLWAIAHQTPLSTEFSRQEYWSGLPFPTPWDLPCPGNEPGSPAVKTDSLPLCLPPGKPKKDTVTNKVVHKRADNTTMCLVHSDI